MTIITDKAGNSPAIELDGLAEPALTGMGRDSDEQQATARRNLAEFTAANNVSMMGGWT